MNTEDIPLVCPVCGTKDSIKRVQSVYMKEPVTCIRPYTLNDGKTIEYEVFYGSMYDDEIEPYDAVDCFECQTCGASWKTIEETAAALKGSGKPQERPQ